MKHYRLYIDDTGIRRPNKLGTAPSEARMDCFGLGGILVLENDVETIVSAHRDFCAHWSVCAPLHSVKIRGYREAFAWLGGDETKRIAFMATLERLVLALPILGLAAVIDRPGYHARYAEKYQGKPWWLCKTACAVLIERAAKYAKSQSATLSICFELTGKKEDHELLRYIQDLRTVGMPFGASANDEYAALTAAEFQAILRGTPERFSKQNPLIQIADLLLYPMARGGYEPDYRPYRTLLEAGKLIDSHLTDAQRPHLGIKYSCFELAKGAKE
jgi:hypothetical protein